jgi:putative hydrolase of the HAD superfamily
LPDRAIVFDLDDTLYPYRAFVRSGFRAVACRLAAERGLSPVVVLRVLRRALSSGRRGQELQELSARFGLPDSAIAALAEVIREHTPSLRLPRESVKTLTALRMTWKLGILSNGEPRIQRRKVGALGVDRLVDSVVFAAECGDGAGKPAPEGFHTVLERLDVPAERTVFVGDDPRTDMAGAAAVGMKTIHLTSCFRDDERCGSAMCRVHVGRLNVIPAIAEQLVPSRMKTHVA